MIGRRRVGHSDQSLADFAAELRELRDRAGQPSYERLATLTHRTRWPQSRTGIHDKLVGVSAPTEEFVKAFVEACRLYAEKRGEPLSAEDADPRILVGRCAQVRKELAEARRLRRSAVEQEPAVDTARRSVARWSPVQLGVHPAIQVRGRGPWQYAMPRYVERRHDRWLRALLTESPGEPKMIALVGGASTGKTRSAYEAVSSRLPDWPLVVPSTPGELADLLSGDAVDAQCVIWLDEAQNYLADAAAALGLRDLLCQGYGEIVVVATLWPVYWNALCAPVEKNAEDSGFQARRVLELATRVDVPEEFDRVDLARARELGRLDPLIAAAVRDCGPRGQITQVLAAGPGLIHHYDGADSFTKAVLTAAMDARRLAYTGLLSADFLHGAAVGYLDEERRAGVAADWFGLALRDCTAKVQGAVAPLTPVRTSPGVGDADGYRLADFLDQHGREILRGQSVPALAWDALADFVAEPADRTAVAQEAARRGLLQHGYLLARRVAADAGEIAAIGIVAAQYQRWGDSEQAVQWWQRAAAQGDSNSMCHLARCREETNDQSAANDWWRSAAELGNPYAVWQYADRLHRLGKPREAEDVLRRAAEAGEPYALQELTKRLESQQRFAEAEELCRNVARRGHLPSAQSMAGLMQLTGMLTKVGPTLKAEDTRALRRAADQGHCAAMSDLARLLERDGQTDEADKWWARAAKEGHAPAIRHMAQVHLSAGETEQAVEWLLRLSDSGDTQALWFLADLRERRDDWPQAEELLRQAIAYGDRHALRHLTERLLRTGRHADAESVLRTALESGHVGSLDELANFVEDRRRHREARLLRTYGIGPGGGTAEPWGPDY